VVVHVHVGSLQPDEVIQSRHDVEPEGEDPLLQDALGISLLRAVEAGHLVDGKAAPEGVKEEEEVHVKKKGAMWIQLDAGARRCLVLKLKRISSLRVLKKIACRNGNGNYWILK